MIGRKCVSWLHLPTSAIATVGGEVVSLRDAGWLSLNIVDTVEP